MPSALTVDDFSLLRTVCEIRYNQAFLIYDRTGQIMSDVRGFFRNVAVASAAPNQSAFAADEGNFTVELDKSGFTSEKLDSSLETYGKWCKAFFGVVTRNLELKVFTRIGLRSFMRAEFKTIEESNAALASMKLPNLGNEKRFNISCDPTEVLFRWQDNQIGATIRLKSDTVGLELVVPREFTEKENSLKRSVTGLMLDIDYYTVAPVDAGQWDAMEWVPQKMRIIRKEIDAIVRRGSK